MGNRIILLYGEEIFYNQNTYMVHTRVSSQPCLPTSMFGLTKWVQNVKTGFWYWWCHHLENWYNNVRARYEGSMLAFLVRGLVARWAVFESKLS